MAIHDYPRSQRHLAHREHPDALIYRTHADKSVTVFDTTLDAIQCYEELKNAKRPTV